MRHEIIEGVATYIPENYGDSMELIRSDYYRFFGKMIKSPIMLWLKHFRSSGLGYLFYFRLCQHRRGLLYYYMRLRMDKFSRKYGLHIPLAAKYGKGLYLGHGISIVVNGGAVIGSNVNLSQFVTIGSMRGEAAIIGDGAYIGPSVCTVERVRIGAGAMIGAGAVVKKDIPSGATAAGVPAKIIKETTAYTPVNELKSGII